MNLNDCRIPSDDDPDGHPLHDASRASGAIACFFRNVRRALLQEIPRWPALVGCVAWLTDLEIIESIAARQIAQIIVQKEDFLRPDGTSKTALREAYERVPGFSLCTDSLPMPFGNMSYAAEPNRAGVRCVGAANRSRRPAHPRMHHKFVVFGDIFVPYESGHPELPRAFDPRAVWTGSFNFTNNGSRSFENAVLISDPDIAKAYAREWATVASLSEPLDWECDWMSPEYRIGS